MREFEYQTHGTCSRLITFSLDGETRVHNIRFFGGCNGNLKGIGALCEGHKAEEVISKLEGIRCGIKDTSCPDQLAEALKKAVEQSNS